MTFMIRKLASMGRPSVTLNPTPAKTTHGFVKILAPPYEACPKCGEMNQAQTGRLWRVADERGLHYECDVCSHSF